MTGHPLKTSSRVRRNRRSPDRSCRNHPDRSPSERLEAVPTTSTVSSIRVPPKSRPVFPPSSATPSIRLPTASLSSLLLFGGGRTGGTSGVDAMAAAADYPGGSACDGRRRRQPTLRSGRDGGRGRHWDRAEAGVQPGPLGSCPRIRLDQVREFDQLAARQAGEITAVLSGGPPRATPRTSRADRADVARQRQTDRRALPTAKGGIVARGRSLSISKAASMP